MPSVIDEYVADVGRRLRGPARLRRDMLTEIHDALTDAAAARPDSHGDRAAVAEFGAAAEIAGGLQEELAVADARRTAALLIGVLGASWAASALAARDGWPQWRGDMPGAGYLWLAGVVDLLVPVSLAAVVLLVTMSRRGRGQRLARLVAGVSAAAITLTGVGGTLLTVLSPHGRITSVLWSAIPFTLVLLSAHRSWQAARDPRPGRPRPGTGPPATPGTGRP